jgi:hypothetical protein
MLVENSLITDEVVEMIMTTKKYVPASWKIRTDETDFWLILDIPMREFESYTISDRIKIAEATNELCEKIKTTGIPCYVRKA